MNYRLREIHAAEKKKARKAREEAEPLEEATVKLDAQGVNSASLYSDTTLSCFEADQAGPRTVPEQSSTRSKPRHVWPTKKSNGSRASYPVFVRKRIRTTRSAGTRTRPGEQRGRMDDEDPRTGGIAEVGC